MAQRVRFRNFRAVGLPLMAFCAPMAAPPWSEAVQKPLQISETLLQAIGTRVKPGRTRKAFALMPFRSPAPRLPGESFKRTKGNAKQGESKHNRVQPSSVFVIFLSLAPGAQKTNFQPKTRKCTNTPYQQEKLFHTNTNTTECRKY